MAAATTTEPVIELNELLEGVKQKYKDVQKELDQGTTAGYIALKSVYPALKITDFKLDKLKKLAEGNVNIHKFLLSHDIVTELKILNMSTFEVKFRLTTPVPEQMEMKKHLQDYFNAGDYFLENHWETIYDNVTVQEDEILGEHGPELVFVTGLEVKQL